MAPTPQPWRVPHGRDPEDDLRRLNRRFRAVSRSLDRATSLRRLDRWARIAALAVIAAAALCWAVMAVLGGHGVEPLSLRAENRRTRSAGFTCPFPATKRENAESVLRSKNHRGMSGNSGADPLLPCASGPAGPSAACARRSGGRARMIAHRISPAVRAKGKAPPRGGAFSPRKARNQAARRLRRMMPRPARAVPSSARLAGSGTPVGSGENVVSQRPVNDVGVSPWNRMFTK